MKAFLEKHKKLILTILVLLIVFVAVFKIVEDYKKSKKIYNIGQLENRQMLISTKGICVFDEFEYDFFNGLKVDVSPNKVFRTGDLVEESSNLEASKQAEELYNFIDSINFSSRPDNDRKTYEKLSENILDKRIDLVDLSFIDSSNQKLDYLKDYKDKLMEFIKEKNISLPSSGFIINFVDGYESILNASSIGDYDKDFIKFTSGKINKRPGLKYVNNKKYYIIADVGKNEDLASIAEVAIHFKDSAYQASVYKFIRGEDSNTVIFSAYDGISEAIDNRFLDMDIEYGYGKGFYVPLEAISQKYDLDGVYMIDGGKVYFTPVKVLEKDEDRAFILYKKEDVLSNLMLDEGIEFKELREFSKIILNPNDLVEGELY